MKRKSGFSLSCLVLAIVMILSVFSGCGGGVSLTYNSSALAEGQVGVAYSATVATATGADEITYTLKDGSSLPAGLAFSDGAISGTPTEAVSAKAFTVVATSGSASAEAEFKITVKAADFTYEGGEVSIEVNTTANATVATAQGASGVTYTIKSGNLPQGLTFNNGAISGTATTVGSATIVVTASAAGVTSVDATWTVNVTNPRLVYESLEIDAGLVGVYYTSLVSTATGANNITYAIAEGATVPAGLTLESDGLLHGKPTARGRQNFTVTASATGFTSATAEISFLVRPYEAESLSGTITFTGGKLDDGMSGSLYSKLTGGIKVAMANNDNAVTYELEEGSTLPAGLTLYENGTLYGTPTAIGDYTFTVKASAEGCTAKTAQFTLKITEPRVPFERFMTLETATVGTPYTADLTPESATMQITFTAQTALPAGLTLDTNGTLHGTPTQSARSFTFTIKGTAAGYSDSTCEIVLAIKDAEVALIEGLMEAEYVDLTGKIGAGYSGAANQEQMVQPGAPQGASNNYYVGYTHCMLMLEFKFTCSEAVSGVKIDIGLASELGDVTFTNNEFDIVLNGTSINYGKFNIKGGASAGSWGNFQNFTATRTASLVAGENTLVLMVKENTFLKGQSTGGPGIDYIKITTGATLKWVPCLYNVRGR